MNMTDTLTETKEKTGTATGTMKAAVLTEPGKFELQQVKIPEPGKGQVRIKLKGCGLCASSIPLWEGREWFHYPAEAGQPGHEGWGTVDAVGAGVTALQEGDLVGFLSDHAYAAYDVADEDAVVKLPDSFRGKPFPAEPLGCAMNIFNRSDIKKGQTVAILGIGFLGALLVQLAKDAGARVIAISKRPWSLQLAEDTGADEVIEMDDHWRIIEMVKNRTGGKFCERVIEATGKEWPLNLGAELCAERGRLIIAGYHQDGMRSVNMQLWNWRGLDVINAHEREKKMYLQGMKEAVEAVEEGRMDPAPLFTHNFSPDELNEAFEMLTSRPDGFVKALIRYE